ncbi:hypothetical protein X777_07739 [Ooceraea biroi]|uniref:Uncharacterized protein n=1 Tax=Ooceraea biroi TaxID=2015173 RepID=A0A026X068_OOCBI|nr:hypothetical protein X777_07739 [Ooceraea biroi]
MQPLPRFFSPSRARRSRREDGCLRDTPLLFVVVVAAAVGDVMLGVVSIEKPNYHHDGGVAALDALWILLGGLARTAVTLLLNLGEFAGNMSSVAVEHRRVAVADLSRMIQHDHLGSEVGGAARRLVLGVTRHVAAPQLLHGDVLHVEADIVTRQGFRQRFMVHLDRFHLSGESRRREGHQHTLKNQKVT